MIQYICTQGLCGAAQPGVELPVQRLLGEHAEPPLDDRVILLAPAVPQLDGLPDRLREEELENLPGPEKMGNNLVLTEAFILQNLL